jgi:FAD/FMN-containing dehydrogenase
MHKLDSISINENYASSYYNGPAVKLGAGVITSSAYVAAAASGYRVVGGTRATEGISGGYNQGGGHSILSSQYGLAADNVLEWEVVTASGDHILATPSQNEDLSRSKNVTPLLIRG